jgi:type II secretory pathway predicted ATPase ExeA
LYNTEISGSFEGPMDYLDYFGLESEPFSNAPLSRFYFASRHHTEALERLRYAASTMKGLAILIGEIGLGKTTLARRMLELLPEEEYEAAMLVIVHAGVTANWLLKRIAIQLGVPSPADDKLTILSQLYQRLVEIHQDGRRAVVLIDEAQMLASRELMEEFRGLLNLEVPERKLISFIFFGLPEIERNLGLDPPLAQRIALRYHMKPLGREDTSAYVEHRLSLAGAGGRELFSPAALEAIYELTRGVPRLVNTLCDNVLLELFFARAGAADRDAITSVAHNLGFGRDFDAATTDAVPEPERPEDPPPVEGGPGADAIVAVDPNSEDTPVPQGIEPDAIAAQVAAEPLPAPGVAIGDDVQAGGPPQQPLTSNRVDHGPAPAPLESRPAETTVDMEDPLALLEVGPVSESRSPWHETDGGIEIQVAETDEELPEEGPTEVVEEGDLDEVEVSVEESEVAPLGVPPPALPTPPPPRPTRPPPRPQAGNLDLADIDALLADIDQTLKK